MSDPYDAPKAQLIDRDNAPVGWGVALLASLVASVATIFLCSEVASGLARLIEGALNARRYGTLHFALDASFSSVFVFVCSYACAELVRGREYIAAAAIAGIGWFSYFVEV